MKRGFLNQKSTKSSDASVNASGPNTTRTTTPVPLPYGAIPNAGPPTDYKPPNIKWQVRDGRAQYAENMMLFTTQPPQTLGMGVADFPDNWTECMIMSDLKQKIVATPGFPKALQRLKDGKKYVIREAEGKGLGMFATADIDPGELILDERPLLVFPVIFKDHFGPTRYFAKDTPHDERVQTLMADQEHNMRMAIARMEKENREAYMALANSHEHDGSGPLVGVARTNAFEITSELIGENGDEERLGRYGAVMNELSRLNHSCSPNTVRKFKLLSFSMSLRATRKISAGSEITTSYILPLDPAHERQKALAPYGLQCTCAACLDYKRTDPIRKWLRRGGLPLEMPNDGKKYKPTDRFDKWIEPGLKLIALHEEQGVEAVPTYKNTLFQVYNAYASIGDAQNAVIYGRKYWLANIVDGTGSEGKDPMYCDVEGVKTYPMFGFGRMAMMNGFPMPPVFLEKF